ncbi:MAG: MlaD family protein [Pirellulaceae bacterium]
MDERVIQFRVGVLVMATLIITVILIVLFGDIPTGLKDSRTIYVRFESAPGVTVNTPVRKSGILVGRITQVDLQDDGSVLVTAKIDADRPLRQNEICRIGTGNVLGDAMMEFVPDPLSNLPPEPLADGAYLEGVVAQDFMSSAGNFMNMLSDFATDLRGTLDSIESAGQEISRVATNLNNVVVNNQDGFNRILVHSNLPWAALIR